MQKRALSLLSVAVAIAATASYTINYPLDTTIFTSDSGKGVRAVTSIGLASSLTSTQTINCSQADDRLLFHDCTDKVFVAPIGESLTASIGFNGTWMHGYVYIDLDQDGEFNTGNEALAYSNYDGKNSAGTATDNGDVGVNPPSFKVPVGTAPGTYRIRYKVDWNCIDPGGCDQEGSTIIENAGAITDAMVYLYDPAVSNLVTVTPDNGTLTASISGSNLTIKTAPDDGYVLESITVTSGFVIDGIGETESFVDASYNPTSVTYPSYLIDGGKLIVSTSALYGDITVSASFAQNNSAGSQVGVYPCSLSGEKLQSQGFSTVKVNTISKNLSSTQRYYYAMSAIYGVLPGSSISVVPNYTGDAQRIQLYIDWNNDGQFTSTSGANSNELISDLPVGETIPSFKVPSDLPYGVYRARLVAEDDCAVDFLLNVHASTGTLNVQAMNGLVLTSDGEPLPNTVSYNKVLSVKTQPCVDGYEASTLIVRHGQNLTGSTYVNGNPQWADNTYNIPASGIVNIPASAVNGDVVIYVIYKEQESSEWTKVWSDEFTRSSIDLNRWKYRSRGTSTWARLIAEDDEIPYVNKIANGSYNAWAIATPSRFTKETQPMISGALSTEGKFSTNRGRVESRIRTRQHTGNFPAFWMMPNDGSLGWPCCGEIDIWETIDSQNKTYGTVHTGWTYKSYGGSPSQSSPTSSGNTYADQSLWHVYAIEWDEESIRWYVDGKQYFSYNNQHFSEDNYTTDITWPFDKEFYIIINQSVGNGAWAAMCDPTFDYLTEFDYVRVYKKKGDTAYTSKVSNNGEFSNFYTPAAEYEDPNASIADVTVDNSDAAPVYYDLNGRRVNVSSLRPGIYVEQRGTTANKILIK